MVWASDLGESHAHTLSHESLDKRFDSTSHAKNLKNYFQNHHSILPWVHIRLLKTERTCTTRGN